MSDQNVIKEGWVQKRGEDRSPPSSPPGSRFEDIRSRLLMVEVGGCKTLDAACRVRVLHKRRV